MGKHEIVKQSAVTQDKALRLALFTFGILLSITTIAGIILTNNKVSADNPAHANASVNVSAACTLSGGATYVDNIPNNSSKTFGPGTLRATCNDPDGYSIYAIGYSNDTYGNTSMVSTVDPDSPSNIPTNTTGSNSWWAMQLSATGATIQNNFDSLHVIPDTYTKVATKTSVAAGTTGESTVNSNYTVSISSTQAAGTYNGKVKYTLIHPNTNLPSEMQFIQDLTLAECQTKATDNDYVVMDKRDGKTYTVRYLADNNCWMTQNLAIEPGTHMTEADTNIKPAQYNHDGYYALPGEGYDLRTDGAAASETSTGYCNGSTGYTNACTHMADSQDIQDIRNADTEGVLDYTNTYTTSNIGSWYNYAAATAGTITGSSTTAVDTNNICPQGWTLPSDTQNRALVTALSGNYLSFNPLYGGDYANGSHNTPATLGYWWSTTANLGTSRRHLWYRSGSLSTNSRGTRYYGFYVRCILAL